MRSTRPFYSILLLLLLTFLTTAIVVRAQDDEEGEDYDVKARVMRVSLLAGEVKLRRHDSADWERAELNRPVIEGDTLTTANEARLEIQVDATNFIRVGPNSILRIVTLRDEGVAVSVVEGTVSLRLAKFDAGKQFFELDGPKTTFAAEKDGLYRMDVDSNGRVRLTARKGGRARIYSEKSGFALRDGRTAELIVDGPDAGEWEMLVAAAADTWDNWIEERDQVLARRVRQGPRYYDEDIWGAEDLESYGVWMKTSDYGWVWRPHNEVISTYANWAPYRYGHWVWVSPYGWTWVGSEPWGWAPYHFGRWVYHDGYWAWSPRSQYQRRRSWWRPALVAFVIDISFGDQICWYPLDYRDRDPRSRHYRRHRDRDRDRRYNPNDRDPRGHGRWRGVTGVARRDFGGRHARPINGDERWRRRVAEAEPQPDVPVRPAGQVDRPVVNGDGDRPRRWTIARRENVPGVSLPERRTGAGDRQPGVPLDRDLRRTRGWNGRERLPQTLNPVGSAGEGTPPTGAVSRPSRGLRDNPINGGANGERVPVDAPAQPATTPVSETPNEVVPPSPEAAPGRRSIRVPSREDRPPADVPAVVPVTPVTPEPSDRGNRTIRREQNEESTPRPGPASRRLEPEVSTPPPRVERPAYEPPPPRNRACCASPGRTRS